MASECGPMCPVGRGLNKRQGLNRWNFSLQYSHGRVAMHCRLLISAGRMFPSEFSVKIILKIVP